MSLKNNNPIYITDKEGIERLIQLVSLIDKDGNFQELINNEISAGNSTTDILLAAEIFTGETIDITKFAIIYCSVISDVGGELFIQQSIDGINFDFIDDFSVMANRPKTFSFQAATKFFRVVYVNGNSNQSFFRLQTSLKKTYGKPSSHKIQDSIIAEDDAELTKSVLSAADENDEFVNIRAIQGDTGYNLKVSVDQIEPTTNSIKVMNYSHAELHAGDHFVTRKTQLLAKNGTRDILIVTPNSAKWAHMTSMIASDDGAIIIYFYENCETSINGTLDGAFNRNRNSIKVNSTLIYDNPTIINVGNLLYSQHLGSGKTVGGGARDTEEILLKANTKYLLRIVEPNIANTNINWILDWYEHINLI